MAGFTVGSGFGSALAGGALIGIAASILLVVNGRIAGISGIAGGIVEAERSDRSWRFLFLAGLVLGGGVLQAVLGAVPVSRIGLPAAVVAGLLVGFGTRLGSGCTSGHGVCGTSRMSKRSIVATMVFLATGTLTATVAHHLGAAR